MCASRALCRRLVGSYAEPSLLAELPRCRLVEADGELLSCVGLPRAGRPGGEVVLVGVELVLHLARRVVEQALGMGYRHVDTAPIYGNEAEVGDLLVLGGSLMSPTDPCGCSRACGTSVCSRR